MTVSHGQDPERVEAVGAALSSLSDRVDSVAQSGRSGVAVLLEAWAGADGERFAGEWDGAERALGDAAQVMRATSQAAQTQAADQRSASGGDGGAGGGAVPLPAAATGGPKASAPLAGDQRPGRGEPLDPEDVPIPIPDDGQPWVPQGFTMTEDGEYYITSMYNADSPGDGILAIQPTDGGPVRYVRLEGNDHYGGVAVDGENVYVSGNGQVENWFQDWVGANDGSQVQQYRFDDLFAAGAEGTDGAVAEPVSQTQVPTGSTITAHDGQLYVAQFNDDGHGDLYQYGLGPDGQLGAGEQIGQVPSHTQGIATDGTSFYATTTVPATGADGEDLLARQSPSQLQQFDPDTGEGTIIRDDLSPLSQGVIIDGDRVILTSESASDEYREDVEAAGLTPEEELQEYELP